MAKDTKPYMIEISEKSRYTLDSLALPKTVARAFKLYGEYSPTTVRRASLQHYFHNRYTDNRPDWLIKAKSWSVEIRQFKTYVYLTDEQIAQVLKLSIQMDIDPKPNVVNPSPSPRGTVRYLLGTFLEAVLAKHIIIKEDEARVS